ncbi:hypothetical protein OG432_24010 [Streptomyces sp. NBC_00442]|uniref:SCO2400 family protein n=1 Tax=Streptomyces sp. NBC_00442 TaxID=2903651 RepID=UPI002E2314CE
MDYCHSCRRHLNGALACAGCGTPAQELAPAPEDELLVYAGAPSRGGAEVLAPSGHRRAARKGRRARRKRGKVVLFGSAGLVLVAGAVGFVQMAMEPPVNDRASSVHEDETISDPQPLPSGPSGGAVTAPSRPTAEPVASRGRGSGAGTGAPGGAGAPRPASPSPKGTVSGPAAPRPSSSEPTSSASPGASDMPGPGESVPPSPSASAPAPPPPAPSPTPSKTCHRILWWCA